MAEESTDTLTGSALHPRSTPTALTGQRPLAPRGTPVRRITDMAIGALVMLALLTAAARLTLSHIDDIQVLRDWSVPVFDVVCGVMFLVYAWTEAVRARRDSHLTLWPLLAIVGLLWVSFAFMNLP